MNKIGGHSRRQCKLHVPPRAPAFPSHIASSELITFVPASSGTFPHPVSPHLSPRSALLPPPRPLVPLGGCRRASRAHCRRAFEILALRSSDNCNQGKSNERNSRASRAGDRGGGHPRCPVIKTAWVQFQPFPRCRLPALLIISIN